MVGGINSFINYSKLVDEAMRNIARQILFQVEKDGLKGDHYFLITFKTFEENVSISDRLLSRYPEEMTIILQHQFESLIVQDDFFSVSLSFDGIKEKITVPFMSLTAIVDPSTKFALQFNNNQEDSIREEIYDNSENNTQIRDNIEKFKKSSPKVTKLKKSQDKVVSLDQFRKNKNNG